MPSSTGNKLLNTVKSHLHLNHDLKQEKHVSVPAKPILPYNPYGLNTLKQKQTNGALSDDVVHPISLPNLSADINDFLPAAYHQMSTNFEVKFKDLQQDYIANGGSAMIRRVKLKDDAKDRIYALKKFALFKTESLESYYHRTSSEFILTRSMHHVHVVEVLEMVKLQLEIPRAWGMIMASYPCDFYKIIRSPKWKYTSIEEKLCCFKQIALGLKYIHEQDVCHLDLKPDNILVSRHGVLKITDFGCSVTGHEIHGDFNSPIQKYRKLLGTPPYQAPESTRYKLMGKKERKPYCPFTFDYYSLGLLLFVIIVGKTPFLDSIDLDKNYKIFVHDYNAYVESHPTFLLNDKITIPRSNRSAFANSYGYAGDWVRTWWRLCDPNPETRMILKDLFKDEWFQSIGICIDEIEYECNFVHHNYKGLQFSVKYGKENGIDKVHRYGGGIRSRSNTISKPRGMSFGSSLHEHKYSSLIPKDIGKSYELINKRRGNHHVSHLMSCKNKELNKSNSECHLNSIPISSSSSSCCSYNKSSTMEDSDAIVFDAPVLQKHPSITIDNENKTDDQLVSLQSLQVQNANISTYTTTGEIALPNIHAGGDGDNRYNFYYPDGETMHYEFTPESYLGDEKFMLIDPTDVIKCISNVMSHEHSSITELI